MEAIPPFDARGLNPLYPVVGGRIEILLTWPEIKLAADAGIMRRMSALRDRRNGVYGATEEGAWDHDINGCLAEMAVAKWANIYWSGTIGRIGAPDVGPLEVRSKVLGNHRLVIRPTDNDDKRFVSVLVTPVPRMTICGWIQARDAKLDKWIVKSETRPPMFFVPESDLRPMHDL